MLTKDELKMKVYRVTYIRPETVYVDVAFADNVNIDDCEHEDLATRAACDGELVYYENHYDGGDVSEYSVEVKKVSDDFNGKPEVVISSDGVSKYGTVKYLVTPLKELKLKNLQN